MLMMLALLVLEEDYRPGQVQITMLLHHNELRRELGLKPDKLDPALSKAAQEQAEWLARHPGRFSHRFRSNPPPKGATPPQRIAAAGFKGRYANEIIAWSSKRDIPWIFGIWKKQVTNGRLAHWAAIKGNHSLAGYGYAEHDGTIMAVGLFGRPRGEVRSQRRSSGSQSSQTYTRRAGGPLRRFAQALFRRRR